MTCGSRCPSQPRLTCDLEQHVTGVHAAYHDGICTTWTEKPEMRLPMEEPQRGFTVDDPDAP